LLLALALLAAAGACSNDDGKLLGQSKRDGHDTADDKDEAKGETDGKGAADPSGSTAAEGGGATPQGTDTPVWVNGVYLTCAWSDAVSATDAAVACKVGGAGAEGDEAGLTYVWTIEGPGGAVILDHAATASSENVLQLAATSYYDSTLAVAVKLGEQVITEVSLAFKTSLPGLADDAPLQGCFNEGRTVADCFAANGIDTSAPQSPPASSFEPGSSTTLEGVTWYLGEASRSCNTFCSQTGHDGASSAMITAAQCAQISLQFGIRSVDIIPTGGSCPLGCTTDGERAMFDNSGAQRPECVAPDRSRFCPCRN
jgi:hypothetical protein